jgi:ribonuclease J
MYRWTRPRIAVPVHGELRHMAEHARLAKSLQVPETLVPANGQLYRLAPGPAELIDEVPCGRLHMDGRVLVAEGEGLAKARRAMGYAGLIAITLVLDQRGRPASEAAILAEGMPQPVESAVRAAVDETLDRYNPKKTDAEELRETVRRAARRAAQDAWGKKPVTRVTVVEL